MRDYLLDLVAHTFDLGCIDLVKISGDDKTTLIEGIAEDRSVVVQGKFLAPIDEFKGVIGMPNLSKLKILLNLSEYKENAEITVTTRDRNGEIFPAGLHFKNQVGDFQNDYRFMTSEIVAEKLKTFKFKGATWNINFEPTLAGIQRLKMQAQANSEEQLFRCETSGPDLKFIFGDHSTHAGEFVFHSPVTGQIKKSWLWPIAPVIAILNCNGDKTYQMSDDGASQITVNSGIAEYHYILPAQTK